MFWNRLNSLQKKLTVIVTIITIGITFYTSVFNVYDKIKENVVMEVEASQELTWKNINVKLDYHEKLLLEIRMDNLKTKIWDKNLPLSERVHAGEEYLGLGGNGATQKEVERLYNEYIQAKK